MFGTDPGTGLLIPLPKSGLPFHPAPRSSPMAEDSPKYPSLPDPWWREETSPNDPSTTPPSPDHPSRERTPRGDVRHFETFRDNQEFFTQLGLSGNQVRAIELTVQGLSDTHIAEQLGINRRTLWRWKNFDDVYRRALENARLQTHAAVIDHYSALLVRSTNIFAKMLQDSSEDKQFRAAQTLISMAGCFRPTATRLPAPQRLPDDDGPDFYRRPEPNLEPKVG
jgi:hypothetical protein